MSDSITQIRSVIQDQPLYQSDVVVANGTETTVQVQYFPVIESTVTITPATSLPAYTVDEQNGVIEFASAPTAATYVITYRHVYLLDSTIQDFIDIEGVDSDVRLAAADALDAIASSQALIQKKIDILDLSTDGPALAKALRDHAAMLRKQVFSPLMEEPSFEIGEQINDTPGWREKILKDWMRTT